MVEEVKTEELVVAGGNSFDYETRLAALKPEERTQLLALTDKIHPGDVSSVQMYGSELNQVVANNGTALLEKVRADNSNEVIALTTDLLNQLELIDIDELGAADTSRWKRFLRRIPFARKMVLSVEQVFNKYDTIAANVEKITKKMGTAKVVAMRDNTTLQQIFDANVEYIKEIRNLIIGLKLKEAQIKEELHRMEEDGSVEAIQIQDMRMFLTSVQRKIADMQVSEQSFTQTLYQIRLAQQNNTSIANQSENIVNNVIPGWKQQLSIAVMANNQRAHIEALKRIKGTTNEILKRNSAALRMNTIEVAKANEEMVINLDTLQKTTEDLIQTITEVKRIQDEGARNRAQLETSLKDNAERLMGAIQDITELKKNKK